MHRRKFPLFRWVAIITILITVILATIELVSYSRIRNNFPLGFQAGGVPIGGLNYTEAAERIYTVYQLTNRNGLCRQPDPGAPGRAGF